MLEKPALPEVKIIATLHENYGLNIDQITFLPLGADRSTAVYRALTNAATPYFVKLRSGDFDERSVTVPKLLHDHGITQIIEPLVTRSGQLWTRLDNFHLMLYPFIDGRSGFDITLSDDHWITFGRALKAVHTTPLPTSLANTIQPETFSPYWREIVIGFQQQVESRTFADPVAAQLAALLHRHQPLVSQLVNEAARLAAILRPNPPDFVLCHSDIHAGNILIETTGALYLVDWDQPILAPKERDLMFVGGGVGTYTPHELDQQDLLFYQGYGQTTINTVALAYYRCERIVQDIAAYCYQLLTTDEGGQDRQQSLDQMTDQFLPGAVIDIALRTLQNLPPQPPNLKLPSSIILKIQWLFLLHL